MRNSAFEKIKYHLPALSMLFVLHCIIFARLIFRTPEGVPYATIPFDFASQFAPWLIYIGDCLKSGIFPLWTPYVGAGTPFFINPQSQLYSPLTLLIGSTIGYTQRVAQLQTVFTLFFGGVGAYYLSSMLWRSRWAGFITAICFTFTSGVFTNLEHMSHTNAFALIPWIFWMTTLTAKAEKWWGYPVLAFFIYFLVTSGYPGVVLMVLFWVFAYTIYLIYIRPETNWMKFRLLIHHGFAWFLGLCLAAVHWVPIVIHRKEFTRGATPLKLDEALWGGNLFFKHIWGMFFQFMIENPLPGNDINISMRGVYFGALALPLIAAALLLLKEKEKIVQPLLVLSVGAFLMACGGMFFGRVALHILLPILNMSRFPSSDSRALMVLGLVLLAGGGATLLQRDIPEGRRLISRACVVLLAVLVAGLFGFRVIVDSATYNNVVINYITAEIVFVGLAILALRIFSGRALLICLATLLVLELGTCVLSNMKIVGSPVEKAEDYLALRLKHQRAFTVEGANVPRIADGTELISEASGQGYTQKTFYLSEYNPMRLVRFERLIANGFTDWMTNGQRVVALPPESRPQNYDSFQQQMQPLDHTILSYRPNQIIYRVNAAQDVLLVFNEIYFPGWRAVVDGKREMVHEVGSGLRGVRVSGGEHRIVMTFRPRSFYIGLTVSLLAAICFMLWLIIPIYRSRRFIRVRDEGELSAVPG